MGAHHQGRWAPLRPAPHVRGAAGCSTAQGINAAAVLCTDAADASSHAAAAAVSPQAGSHAAAAAGLPQAGSHEAAAISPSAGRHAAAAAERQLQQCAAAAAAAVEPHIQQYAVAAGVPQLQHHAAALQPTLQPHAATAVCHPAPPATTALGHTQLGWVLLVGVCVRASQQGACSPSVRHTTKFAVHNQCAGEVFEFCAVVVQAPLPVLLQAQSGGSERCPWAGCEVGLGSPWPQGCMHWCAAAGRRAAHDDI